MAEARGHEESTDQVVFRVQPPEGSHARQIGIGLFPISHIFPLEGGGVGCFPGRYITPDAIGGM